MAFFFYSDPHFGHKNVINYCNRPFKDVAEMNSELVRRYNTIVRPEDTVLWLGDCFFLSPDEASKIMKQLNGTKVLVKGNHDLSANTMYRIGFQFVCEMAQIRIGKTYLNLSHYPYKRRPWNHLWKSLFNKKYRSKLHFRRLIDDGSWLIHGHTHSKVRLNGKMIHVGVDAWSYAPVSFPEIAAIVDQVENK
jgi:calcineurin-like phosphoesterase family protein